MTQADVLLNANCMAKIPNPQGLPVLHKGLSRHSTCVASAEGAGEILPPPEAGVQNSFNLAPGNPKRGGQCLRADIGVLLARGNPLASLKM